MKLDMYLFRSIDRAGTHVLGNIALAKLFHILFFTEFLITLWRDLINVILISVTGRSCHPENFSLFLNVGYVLSLKLTEV